MVLTQVSLSLDGERKCLSDIPKEYIFKVSAHEKRLKVEADFLSECKGLLFCGKRGAYYFPL